MKPILCVDFDGVLHSYASGWKGADVIPDPPVPGAMAFLVAAAELFDVSIYSSRSSLQEGVDAMRQYLAHHLVGHVPESIYGNPRSTGGEPTMRALHFVREVLKWPREKPSAFLTLDDRAITFNGRFPDPRSLLDFKPWNKRPSADAEKKESDAEVLARLGDDAAKWAAEFRQTAIRLGYSDMDEGWLISWFANAIEGSAQHRRNGRAGIEGTETRPEQ